jgi:hypothetical protein
MAASLNTLACLDLGLLACRCGGGKGMAQIPAGPGQLTWTRAMRD